MLVKLALWAGFGVLIALLVARLAGTWLRYRGRRLIVCPENRTPAGITVDARHAAMSAFGSGPDLRLSACSRWPERAGCGQECLTQVAESPEDCLVRHILMKWYEGKRCASCGAPFHTISWLENPPALLGPTRISQEWSAIPAERLSEVLQVSAPLCFACHMASTLVREHPELAVERPAGISPKV